MVCNQLGRTCKDTTVPYFNALSRYLLVKTDKTTRNLSSFQADIQTHDLSSTKYYASKLISNFRFLL
jgi:hypothetical protein